MSRVQLALNVADLDASVRFYTELFGTEPHKLRPGYANFAVTQPPLKLVLIEVPGTDRGHGVAGALNHLGVEVESTEDVHASTARLSAAGLATFEENDTTCCYALQDKVWVHDPAGAPWEIYTVKDDTAESTTNEGGIERATLNDGACCTPSTDVKTPDVAAAGAGCC